MRHPAEILGEWSGQGKLPHELSQSEIADLRKRIGQCNDWLRARIEFLVNGGLSVRQAVIRATNESGMTFGAADQERMIDAGEKARERCAENGKATIEIVSDADFEKEKVRAKKAGDLILQAKRYQ